MVSSIAYTQRCCVENEDTQAEKLKIPLTLKRSKCNNGKTNLNYDCNDLVIKNTWTTLLRHLTLKRLNVTMVRPIEIAIAVTLLLKIH